MTRLRLVVVVALMLWMAVSPCRGQTYRYLFSWNTNSAGNWNNGALWNNDTLGTNGTGPPGSPDKARFARNTTHQVNFVQDATVSEIDVTNDNVTFDLNGFTLSLTGSGIDTIVDTQALVVAPTSSTGRLTVIDGTVNSQGLVIGGPTGTTAEVVAGAGGIINTQSAFEGFGYLLIARNRNAGTLRIQNGGVVNNEYVALATNDQGTPGVTTATVIVNGAGSTWTSGNSIAPLQDYIGFANQSTATVQVVNGGTANLYQPWFGYGDTATGIGLISGAGAKLSGALGIIIGAYGTGQVTVESGGRIETAPEGSILLGVRVDSAFPGAVGQGTLTVRTGGTAASRAFLIGQDLGFSGSMTVDGAGTVATQNDPNRTVTVGQSGAGTLGVTGGGVFNAAGAGYVGRLSGSTGTLSVSGAGSAVNFGGALHVGVDGAGSVQVSSGGLLTSSGGQLGGNEATTGGSSQATISGTNSHWNSGAGTLIIGRNEAATVQVSGGGRLSNSGSTLLGFVPGTSDGSLTVTGAGSRFNGHFVGIGGDASFSGTGGAGLLTVSSNAVATAESTLLVRDRLSLTTGGSMTVGPGAAASPTTTANTLTVRAGGLVQGHGTITGTVSNTAGRVLVAGPELQLAISGPFTQGGNGLTSIPIQSAGAAGLNYGQILVSGAVTLDGTLELLVDAAYEPQFGDSFSVLQATSVSGNYDAVTGRDLAGRGPGGANLVLAQRRGPASYELFVTAPGDATLDGQVTGADYTRWADGYGAANVDFTSGDFNGDGQVSGADYTIWADNYGQVVSASPGAGVASAMVPEPSYGISILVLVILIHWFRLTIRSQNRIA